MAGQLSAGWIGSQTMRVAALAGMPTGDGIRSKGY